MGKDAHSSDKRSHLDEDMSTIGRRDALKGILKTGPVLAAIGVLTNACSTYISPFSPTTSPTPAHSPVQKDPGVTNPNNIPGITHCDFVPVFIGWWPEDETLQHQILTFCSAFVNTGQYSKSPWNVLQRDYGVQSAIISPPIHLPMPSEQELPNFYNRLDVDPYIESKISTGVFPHGKQILLFYPATLPKRQIYGLHAATNNGTVYCLLPHPDTWDTSPEARAKYPEAIRIFNANPFSKLAFATGHEMMEAASDPNGTQWGDRSTGEEIADKCQSSDFIEFETPAGTVLITGVWDQSRMSCSPAPGTIVAPDNPTADNNRTSHAEQQADTRNGNNHLSILTSSLTLPMAFYTGFTSFCARRNAVKAERRR